jgi:hypothetical protein
MIEFLVRLQIVVTEFIKEILANPLQTVIATGAIFLVSIAFFSSVYVFFYRFHRISIVRHSDKNIIGAVVPLPAFQLSEVLRKRIEVRVKNDLRLRDFAGNSTNVAWQSFSQDDYLSRQFPDEGPRWREFRDIAVLGLTPSDMVEKTFRRYGQLEFKIPFYRDNSFDVIFPIKVLREYFRIQSVEDLQLRMREGRLNPQENALFLATTSAAQQIRQSVLEAKSGQLGWLSDRLENLASEVERVADDKPRLRDIFYGEVLSAMAPPGMHIEFAFESLPLNPEWMDFIYMSTMLATSNVPSELTPVTTDVRIVIWIQLMLSYFNLALMVAALVKWLKIG